ncbi:hypothetical protein S101413_03557 [Bacillus velezensis]|nr:hypothetical protein S101413_03557 [Bacillus velezensis]
MKGQQKTVLVGVFSGKESGVQVGIKKEPSNPAKETAPKEDRSKWVEVAEKNGISKATFYWRVTSGGWDEERAATTPPTIFDRDECMRRARQKSPYGKYRRHSPELIALAESNGIKYKTYAFRVSAGWTLMKLR